MNNPLYGQIQISTRLLIRISLVWAFEVVLNPVQADRIWFKPDQTRS